MELNCFARLAFLLLAAPCLAAPAQAQSFPTRNVRILVTVSPGGGPSLAATLLADQMGPLLGQSVTVDHKAGGGGVPGILDIMNAPADGHTLIVLDSQHWAIAPAMSKDLPYDTLRDLAPIGSVYKSVQVIVVGSAFPAKDMKEMLAMARAKPGALQYAALGGGSVHQLIMESLKSASGVDIQHIPYKGGSQSIAGVLAGDVPIACAGLNNVLPFVQAGKMRILATAAGTRTRQNPEIPTVAEAAGLQDFHFVGELGLFTRAGVPKPVIEKLAATFRKAAANPDLVARGFKGGLTIEASSPEEMAETVRADIKRYAQAVKVAGLIPAGKR